MRRKLAEVRFREYIEPPGTSHLRDTQVTRLRATDGYRLELTDEGGVPFLRAERELQAWAFPMSMIKAMRFEWDK